MRLSSCLLIFLCLTPLTALPVRPIPRLMPRHASPWIRMNQRAGLIFAGNVLRIRRVPATHLRDVETVEISFQVEQAVRGTHNGQTLIIREWAGLWASRPRYRVGERAVLFLYPASRLGLTSPVGGDTGRFAVDPQGRVVLTPAQAAWLDGGRVLPALRVKDALPLREFLRQVRSAPGGQP
jgi:hypothetical protein